MSDRNRRVVLAERPTGMVDERTTRVEENDVPQVGAGEALAKVRYLSIDPTIRTWMDDAPGYLPPIGIGDVVRSSGVAEVLQSDSERYAPGDLLFGLTGWQDYVIADEGERAMQKLPAGVSPTAALGVLGLNGVTAYFGLLDVGKLKEGDVVVVSGAAGATGSAAGQIAKLKGAAKVVGIAGGPEKCAWIVDELGFDAATTRARTWRSACASSARMGSTCTSTTSEARSSTRASRGWRCADGSCCAGRSPLTTSASALADSPTTPR
jgi:NADPH-dependent curcumin reductase CurA